MYIIVQIGLLLLCCVIISLSVCDKRSGPGGDTDCIDISRYQGKQWGTCYTAEYINQTSRGNWFCEDRTAKFCYLQCMLDKFNINSGKVGSSCLCDPSSTTTLSPGSTISPACLTPDGSDCLWYRECLERKYPCTNTEAPYAIQYAEHFCNAYSNNYNWFSSKGRRWIDSVRHCLQTKLVHLLNQQYNDRPPTCKEIHDKAIDSHTPCYLDPWPDAPSMCDISFADWGKVFWTVKKAFKPGEESVASLKGAIQTLYQCGLARPVVSSLKYLVQQLQITLDTIESSLTPTIDLDKLANQIVNQMVSNLGFDLERIQVFAYADLNEHKSLRLQQNQFTIQVLIADTNSINTTTDIFNATNPYLLEQISKIENALTKGDLKIATDYGVFYPTKVSECLDMNCNTTINPVTAPPPHNDTFKSRVHSIWLVLLLLLTIVFV